MGKQHYFVLHRREDDDMRRWAKVADFSSLRAAKLAAEKTSDAYSTGDLITVVNIDQISDIAKNAHLLWVVKDDGGISRVRPYEGYDGYDEEGWIGLSWPEIWENDASKHPDAMAYIVMLAFDRQLLMKPIIEIARQSARVALPRNEPKAEDILDAAAAYIDGEIQSSALRAEMKNYEPIARAYIYTLGYHAIYCAVMAGVMALNITAANMRDVFQYSDKRVNAREIIRNRFSLSDLLLRPYSQF